MFGSLQWSIHGLEQFRLLCHGRGFLMLLQFSSHQFILLFHFFDLLAQLCDLFHQLSVFGALWLSLACECLPKLLNFTSEFASFFGELMVLLVDFFKVSQLESLEYTLLFQHREFFILSGMREGLSVELGAKSLVLLVEGVPLLSESFNFLLCFLKSLLFKKRLVKLELLVLCGLTGGDHLSHLCSFKVTLENFNLTL